MSTLEIFLDSMYNSTLGAWTRRCTAPCRPPRGTAPTALATTARRTGLWCSTASATRRTPALPRHAVVTYVTGKLILQLCRNNSQSMPGTTARACYLARPRAIETWSDACPLLLHCASAMAPPLRRRKDAAYNVSGLT